MKKKLLCSGFVLYFSAGIVHAANPSSSLDIAFIPDQGGNGDNLILPGSTYSFSPLIIGPNSTVQWSKEYGPDEVHVDPSTGQLTWDIPANLPYESYHLGIKATDDTGYTLETWIVTIGDGNIIHVGPNETYTNLTDGLRAMQSGDTLVMRNGVYEGQMNKMASGNRKRIGPPSGNPNAFTTVMAEDPGQVIIDSKGMHEHQPFRIMGNYIHPDWGHKRPADFDDRSYIALKGLVALDAYSAGIQIEHSHHIKLIDMGVGDAGITANRNPASVYIWRSDNILIEGLYAWGRSRYKLQFMESTNGVARRVVARIDEYGGSEPLGGLVAYCSKNIRFQNNIVVDGDSRRFWTDTKHLLNIYGVPATNCTGHPENIAFEKSIGLNTHLGLMQTSATEQDSSKPTVWRDIIGWKLEPDREKKSLGINASKPILVAAGPSISENITLGDINFIYGKYFLYSRSANSYINNSLFHNLGFRDGAPMYQGDLFRNGSTTAKFEIDHFNLTNFMGQMLTSDSNPVTYNNQSAIDPALKYLVELPEDSVLRSAGKGGINLGAEVLTFVGRSNTFFGDPGFEDETGISMWPFPHEDLIQRTFRNYRYTGQVRNDDGTLGGIETLFGARGFAACNETEQQLLARAPSENCQAYKKQLNGIDNITLTSYIWEYLGNPIPSHIYNNPITPDYQTYSKDWTPQYNALKAYWNMNGNWNDASGFDHHGAIYGDPQFIDRGITAPHSAHFDGIGDKMFVPSSFTMPTGDFSISAWIKADSFDQAPQNMIAYNESYKNSGFRLGVSRGGKVSFWTTESGGSINVSTPPITPGSWNYVTVTYDATTTTSNIYLNGKLAMSGSGIYTPSSAGMSIGNGGGWTWKGDLDEIAIFSTVLSDGDIAKIYRHQSGLFLNSGLAGYWKFNQSSWNGTPGEIIDSSGNNAHGQLNTGSTLSVVGKHGSGIPFTEGTVQRVSVNATSLPEISNTFTYAFWLNSTDNAGAWKNIMSRHQVATDGYGIYKMGAGDGRIYIRVDNTLGNNQTACRTQSGVFDGKWHHIAFSVDNGQCKVYVNGVLETNASYNAEAAFAQNYELLIGNAYNGQLDGIAYWNRALSADEVKTAIKMR